MSTIKAGNTATTTLLRTPDLSGNLTFAADNQLVLMNTNTGEWNLPSGTTAQRPASPTSGMLRYNTTLGDIEIYLDSAWTNLSAYSATYLLVAGGGGGGASTSDLRAGGGGGAGGYLTGTVNLYKGTKYTAVVGAGGTGGAYTDGTLPGTVGSNSTIFSFTALGGGYGAGVNGSGGSGGSGGGAGDGTGTPGSGTAGQGYAGGSGYTVNVSGSGGAGGGSSAIGGNGVSGSGSVSGGTGTASSITGSSVTRAAGGPSSGSSSAGYTNATANTGNGGGAYSAHAGLNGGSGVVILSVPTTNFSNNYANATITTSGSNTIITFNTSGSYTA